MITSNLISGTVGFLIGTILIYLISQRYSKKKCIICNNDYISKNEGISVCPSCIANLFEENKEEIILHNKDEPKIQKDEIINYHKDELNIIYKNIEIDEDYWKYFIDGVIVINCETIKEAKSFLNYCHNKNLKWKESNYFKDGKSLIPKTYWNEHQKETAYRYAIETENGGLGVGNIKEYVNDYNCSVVKYKNIIKNKELKENE